MYAVMQLTANEASVLIHLNAAYFLTSMNAQTKQQLQSSMTSACDLDLLCVNALYLFYSLSILHLQTLMSVTLTWITAALMLSVAIT